MLAYATYTTITSTGGSTSTLAPQRTTRLASSTLRPSSPRTTGTPTASRPRVGATLNAIGGGGSGTRRPATHTTLSQARTTASRITSGVPTCGSYGSTEVRSTTEYPPPRAKQDPPSRTQPPTSTASTTGRLSATGTWWSGTRR